MNISRNTILITGGASGIGFALAKEFIKLGNTVIICGRDGEKLDAAKEILPEVSTITCDITDHGDLAELQAQLSARFTELNMLINNAGIQVAMDFTETGVDETLIDQEIQTNLTAHIKLTNRLLPLLSSQPHSAIVFIGSALARVPKISSPVYCAAKAGIHSFTQSLRHQLNGLNTTVIEVIPDLVKTAMTENRPDAKKTTPEELTQSVIEGLKVNNEEIFIGRTRMLFSLHRLAPKLAWSIINKNA